MLDVTRLRVLVAVARTGSVTAAAQALNYAQPSISHHMKVLHDAGLVDRDKRGVWVYYRARPEALASLGALIGR